MDAEYRGENNRDSDLPRSVSQPAVASTDAPRLWCEGSYLALEIDAAIYATPVALAALYKFTDRAYVWLQSASVEGRYIAFLKPRTQTADSAAFMGEFMNELADQAIRRRLDADMAHLRTLITAQAFSEANLLHVVAQPAEHT